MSYIQGGLEVGHEILWADGRQTSRVICRGVVGCSSQGPVGVGGNCLESDGRARGEREISYWTVA